MESFWGSLKNELIHHKRYKTRTQAVNDITSYIEIFYNRVRRHTRLGNVSPAQFAKQFELNQVQSLWTKNVYFSQQGSQRCIGNLGWAQEFVYADEDVAK